MIVTLGMMNVLQALAMMYTNGQFVQMADSNAWFTQIGKGSVGPVPISTIIMVIFIIIMGYYLNRSVYGHQVMSVGGNDEARAQWEALLALAREAKELNRVNGMLINKQLAHNQGVLNALRMPAGAGADVGGVYGASGQTLGSGPSKRYVIG